MGSSSPASPEFLRVFSEEAGAAGVMPFDVFMRLALFHPEVGYYRQPRPRVGYGTGTDFFTATTSGSVFGELVVAASVKLLADRDPRRHVFVEIGAEPGRSVLDGVTHPFAETKTVRLGDALQFPERCVVFSNELFDAQPCRRFRFHDDRWLELGVALRDGALTESVLDTVTRPLPPGFPKTAIQGYTIDAPEAAAGLADAIAATRWAGLFLAFDYGKSWRELVEATPAGTARAYFRHTQSNDLLGQPGQQDLTCHVCWDWLSAALTRHGFASPQVETQEAFLIHHAAAYLAPAIAADAAQFTARKRSLLQLLHGAHLGQKFQVLHALRDE